MKRGLSLLLSLLLILPALPPRAQAATTIVLSNGIYFDPNTLRFKFSSDNALIPDNELESYGLNWEASTLTLTMTNVDLSIPGHNGFYFLGYTNGSTPYNETITINLVGDNKIVNTGTTVNSLDDYNALTSNCNLNIVGSGTLTLKSASQYALKSWKKVTLDGPSLILEDNGTTSTATVDSTFEFLDGSITSASTNGYGFRASHMTMRGGTFTTSGAVGLSIDYQSYLYGGTLKATGVASDLPQAAAIDIMQSVTIDGADVIAVGEVCALGGKVKFYSGSLTLASKGFTTYPSDLEYLPPIYEYKTSATFNDFSGTPVNGLTTPLDLNTDYAWKDTLSLQIWPVYPGLCFDPTIGQLFADLDGDETYDDGEAVPKSSLIFGAGGKNGGWDWDQTHRILGLRNFVFSSDDEPAFTVINGAGNDFELRMLGGGASFTSNGTGPAVDFGNAAVTLLGGPFTAQSLGGGTALASGAGWKPMDSIAYEYTLTNGGTATRTESHEALDWQNSVEDYLRFVQVAATPVITTQLTSADYYYTTGTRSLSVAASCSDSNTISNSILTYQWYSGSDENNVTTLLSGKTGTTLTVPANQIDTIYYRCHIANRISDDLAMPPKNSCAVYSDVARITIGPRPDASASFSVDATTVTVNIQNNTVTSTDSGSNWSVDNKGWKYIDADNYLALSNVTAARLQAVSGVTAAAFAGVNRIHTIHTGSSPSDGLILGGSGIIYAEQMSGSGELYLAGAALFLRDAKGFYVLQGDATLDEHFTLPDNQVVVIPDGVTLSLNVLDRSIPGGDIKINTAELVIPAGSELRVENGGKIVLTGDSFGPHYYAPKLLVHGKLAIYDGGQIDNQGSIVVEPQATLWGEAGSLIKQAVSYIGTLRLSAAAAQVEAHLAGGSIYAIPASAVDKIKPWNLSFVSDISTIYFDEFARTGGVTEYVFQNMEIKSGASLVIVGHDTTASTFFGMPDSSAARPAPRISLAGGLCGGGNLSIHTARVDSYGDATVGTLSLLAGTLNVNGAFTAGSQNISCGTLNIKGGAMTFLGASVTSASAIPRNSVLNYQERDTRESLRLFEVQDFWQTGGTPPADTVSGDALSFSALAGGLPPSVSAEYSPTNKLGAGPPYLATFTLDRFEVHGLDRGGNLHTWLVTEDAAFTADTAEIATALYVTAIYTHCESGGAQAGGNEQNTMSDATWAGALGGGGYSVPSGNKVTGPKDSKTAALSSNNNNSSPTPVPPVGGGAAAERPTEIRITVEPQLNGETATLPVTGSTAQDILKRLNENSALLSLTLAPAPTAAPVRSTRFELELSLLAALSQSEVDLTLEASAGSLHISSGELGRQLTQQVGSAPLVIEIGEPNSLTEQQQRIIGDRPALSLSREHAQQTRFTVPVQLRLPYSLKDGEHPSGLVFKYVAPDGQVEILPHRYENGCIIVNLPHFSIFFVDCDASIVWENPFSDVGTLDWFYHPVRIAYCEGLMTGVPGGLFAPAATVTRAQLAVTLYRMENSPAVSGGSSFTDVNGGAWYADAVIWAARNRIVLGDGSGRFHPDDNISREQLVTMLYRYYQYKGYHVGAQSSLAAFSDADSVSGYAAEPMAWAVSSGLIQGTGAGILAPRSDLSRAQLAQVFYNMLQRNGGI